MKDARINVRKIDIEYGLCHRFNEVTGRRESFEGVVLLWEERELDARPSRYEERRILLDAHDSREVEAALDRFIEDCHLTYQARQTETGRLVAEVADIFNGLCQEKAESDAFAEASRLTGVPKQELAKVSARGDGQYRTRRMMLFGGVCHSSEARHASERRMSESARSFRARNRV